MFSTFKYVDKQILLVVICGTSLTYQQLSTTQSQFTKPQNFVRRKSFQEWALESGKVVIGK